MLLEPGEHALDHQVLLGQVQALAQGEVEVQLGPGVILNLGSRIRPRV